VIFHEQNAKRVRAIGKGRGRGWLRRDPGAPFLCRLRICQWQHDFEDASGRQAASDMNFAAERADEREVDAAGQPLPSAALRGATTMRFDEATGVLVTGDGLGRVHVWQEE
jgi:hypothetical protein